MGLGGAGDWREREGCTNTPPLLLLLLELPAMGAGMGWVGMGWKGEGRTDTLSGYLFGIFFVRCWRKRWWSAMEGVSEGVGVIQCAVHR